MIIKRCFIVALLLISVGCAGHQGNPIMSHQFGDWERSCRALEAELNNLDHGMRTLFQKTDKTGKNIGLGVAGLFLIVPAFFMDFKNGERVEYEAMRERYNYLLIIAAEKDCKAAFNRPPIESLEVQHGWISPTPHGTLTASEQMGKLGKK